MTHEATQYSLQLFARHQGDDDWDISAFALRRTLKSTYFIFSPKGRVKMIVWFHIVVINILFVLPVLRICQYALTLIYGMYIHNDNPTFFFTLSAQL
jgi:hypothetical protein